MAGGSSASSFSKEWAFALFGHEPRVPSELQNVIHSGIMVDSGCSTRTCPPSFGEHFGAIQDHKELED
eukprot:3475625-Alexandrium_andersonii.AAC.1